MLSVGYLPPMFGEARFSLQNCAEKKIIFGDEFQYEKSHIERLKLLLGGFDVTVS